MASFRLDGVISALPIQPFSGEVRVGNPMSTEYDIEVVEDFTLITVKAKPTLAMFKEIVDRLAEEDIYERRIWDIRNTQFDFTEEETIAIAEYGEEKFEKQNFMAVVVNEMRSDGITKEYAGHREPGGTTIVQVCHSIEEARKWLRRISG